MEELVLETGPNKEPGGAFVKLQGVSHGLHEGSTLHFPSVPHEYMRKGGIKSRHSNFISNKMITKQN